MKEEIKFQSYCWSIGTTSYRTDNFNMSIEKQLQLMYQFRNIKENIATPWKNNNELQRKYYEFLRENNFVRGQAARPDKDAREKTSGLRDIGLLDDERNLTPAGLELLAMTEANSFSSNNFLEISQDSYLYLKQLLKTSNKVGQNVVRPFVIFLYVINKLEYLTYDEFTYLLPLCVDKNTTNMIVEAIKKSRNTGHNDYENIILTVLMKMDNYQTALEQLKSGVLTEELICHIGINRKSPKYDKPYYELYSILNKIVFEKENLALELYLATKKLTNSKIGGAWRKYFFNSTARSVIKRNGLNVLHNVPILQAKTQEHFKEEFFKIMHLFKAKATLSDYFDLNRRYFKITDIVLFEDSMVKLDIIPQCYVEMIADHILSIAFSASEELPQNIPLKDIASFFDVDKVMLYHRLGQKLGITISSSDMAHEIINDERYTRFNKLIDEKFDTSTLISLLHHFENRNDEEIRNLVTDNADIPTIFEYILGIIWYIISERKGKVLEYMNLSLEADLLPKTHAGGGEADIVWQYDQTIDYPKHTLLLEATLADGSNQRRMEMEPVSRHLGEYLLAHPNIEAYCIFITTLLNHNVISDFRARKNAFYYNSSGTNCIEGMKILPIQTSELKTLLKFRVKYPQIYHMLDIAYQKDGAPKEWYEANIVKEADKYGAYEISSHNVK